MSNDRAEIVDFRLTRVHSDPNSQHIVGPPPTENPSEKELRSLIKDLSLGQGLDQLVRSTATETKFHYRRYKELSAFLRGLMLNFPTITSLRRYQGRFRPLSSAFKAAEVISVWCFCLVLCFECYYATARPVIIFHLFR